MKARTKIATEEEKSEVGDICKVIDDQLTALEKIVPLDFVKEFRHKSITIILKRESDEEFKARKS